MPHHAYVERAGNGRLRPHRRRAVRARSSRFLPFEHSPSAKEIRARQKAEKTEGKEASRRRKNAGQKEESERRKRDKAGRRQSQEDEEDEEAGWSTRRSISHDVAKRWGWLSTTCPRPKKSNTTAAPSCGPGEHISEPEHFLAQRALFPRSQAEWKVLYMCGTMPVVIERQYGHGSIVLVADSFLVSNEALRSGAASALARPPFLRPADGRSSTRNSHGVARRSRHRLAGAQIPAARRRRRTLAARRSLRLEKCRALHPGLRAAFAERDVVAGKESSEGFINLLRRTIRPSAIFETCLAEWRKAFAHQPRELAKVEEIWAQEQARPAPRARPDRRLSRHQPRPRPQQT